MAGGSGDEDGIVGAALGSLETGEEGDFALPAPAPLPLVRTRDAAAAAAGIDQLTALAETLSGRLEGEGRSVDVWIERSVGDVRVVNTRGMVAEYEGTLVGLGATLRFDDGRVPACRVHHAGTDLPGLEVVESLAAEVVARVAPRALEDAALPESVSVCFTSRAAHALLRPLRSALNADLVFSGRGAIGPVPDRPIFSTALSLTDDPLVDGRPGSRPVDDEGVVGHPARLITRGRVTGWVTNLASGARLGIPSTGHGWRTGQSPARIRYSNWRIGAGEHAQKELLGLVGDGLLVAELEPQSGNATGGAFVARAPWAYRVRGGEIVGRLDGVVVTGNLFELLSRVAGIGAKEKWIGSAEMPMIAIEGVGVRVER